jgi:tetratricopeptide (TPR) repeat protein
MTRHLAMTPSNSTPSKSTSQPHASTELFRLGVRQLRAGQLDEAKRSFKENEARAGAAAQTNGLLQQAEQALAQGQQGRAIGLYLSVLERNPSVVEAYLGLGRLAVAAGELEQAQGYATGATRLAPQRGLGWTLLGLVEEAKGNPQAALPLYAKGVALSPNVFRCQLDLGRALLSHGPAQAALGPLTAATELKAGDADAFGLLGSALLEAGQPLPALRALERAKELDPTSARRWAALADALTRAGEPAAAADLMDHALARLGELPLLLEKGAAAALMTNQGPRAIRYLEREQAVAPDHLPGWLTLANLYLVAGALDLAERATRKVLACAPWHAEAWLLLGNLCDATKREDEAIEAFTMAITIAEDDFRPLVNLAMVYLESAAAQRYPQAVELLERATQLVPEGEWRAHYDLALAYVRLGRVEEALELARRIRKEAAPDDPTAEEARRLELNLLEAREAQPEAVGAARRPR